MSDYPVLKNGASRRVHEMSKVNLLNCFLSLRVGAGIFRKGTVKSSVDRNPVKNQLMELLNHWAENIKAII